MFKCINTYLQLKFNLLSRYYFNFSMFVIRKMCWKCWNLKIIKFLERVKFDFGLQSSQILDLGYYKLSFAWIRFHVKLSDDFYCIKNRVFYWKSLKYKKKVSMSNKRYYIGEKITLCLSLQKYWIFAILSILG